MSDSSSKTSEELLTKSESLKKINEHNRDYLSLTFTIPLGNPALKNVHTNQWLFTGLPKSFILANWEYIAKALNSVETRYEQFVMNRWYVESVDISVDVTGKGEMKLTVNPFASTMSSYTEMARDIRKAYDDTVNNQSKSDSKDSSSAVNNKDSVINSDWVKKYEVPSVVVNKIKEVCSVSKTDEQNVKAWFKWMDGHIGYAFYTNHQRSIQTVMSRGSGNCVDNSRVFRAGCHALGVKCNFIRNSCIGHQYNKVYLNGKGVIVDTGRQLASWGSHWGSSGCPTETETSW